ncbi:MAG: DNA topoisomerase [Promethearchaeota archaeon]
MGASISIFAEKPSIARALVKAFSIVYKLKFKSRKGKTRFNYIFESTISTHEIQFKIEKDEYRLRKKDQLIISSVTGHILNFDYPPPFDKDTNWHNSDPLDMIELTPIEIPIKKNMVSHVEEIGASSDVIVIATDWDGHGESIGRQILEIATRQNKKLRHGRMHFTSTSPNSLKIAFETQTDLNWDWIKQVDSLRKQDLRMGSSITRFLTVGIQNQGINRMISYGPCQTSVLWLITNRFLENRSFTPTKFWKLSVKITTSEGPLFLDWKGNPVSEEAAVDTLLSTLKEFSEGIITEYNEESATFKRPLPLDTDTLESKCAQFFRISPKQVADIAERLYNNGFITYPRTESSFYLEKDLTNLVENFISHNEFGSIAKECIALEGVKNPSKGRFTKDHEPIKPVKAVEEPEVKKAFEKTPVLANQAWNIYSYIVWRFLATVHSDATVVNQYVILTAAQEEFIARGRRLIDLGFLKFYKFRTLKGKELPRFEKGGTHSIEAFKHQGFTTPPPLWSESQLIREMAKLNLGTDATRSTHIETVQKRMYTMIQGPRRMLIPTALGMALYQIFTQKSEDLILPEIRGKVESWTQQIREHEKTPEDVDKLVIELTTRGLQKMKANQDEIFSTLVQSVESMTGVGKTLGVCPDCQGNLVLHQGKGASRFLKCSNPLCEVSLPLPKKGELTAIYNENCRICNSTPLLISSKSYNWVMCPICWTRKAGKDHPWFCTNCNRTDCPFSGSWEVTSPEQHLGSCPECGGDVLLKFDQQNTQVICNKCNRTWKAPNLRKGTSIILSDPCEKCGRQTLSIIKRGKKPYRLCVFCSLFFFQE